MQKLTTLFLFLAAFTLQAQSDVDAWKVENLETKVSAQAQRLNDVSVAVTKQVDALATITERQGNTANDIQAIKAALKSLSAGKDTSIVIDGEQINLFVADVKTVVDGGKDIYDQAKQQNPNGALAWVLALLGVIAKLLGTGAFTAWFTQVTKVYHKIRGFATGKPRSAVVSLAISFVLSLAYHAFVAPKPFDFAAFGVTASVMFTATIALYEGVLRFTKWFKPVEQPQQPTA